jgi:hypothetical protein
MEAADPFIIAASGVALSTADGGVAGTGNATNGNGDNWSYCHFK